MKNVSCSSNPVIFCLLWDTKEAEQFFSIHLFTVSFEKGHKHIAFAQSSEATEFCEEQTEIHAIPCKPQHKLVFTSEATNN